jgi:hypothetical protein
VPSREPDFLRQSKLARFGATASGRGRRTRLRPTTAAVKGPEETSSIPECIMSDVMVATSSKVLHRFTLLAVSALVALCTLASARGGTVFLDFDSLSDSDIVTNQFPSLIFSNTIVLSAGISLNEFEFPPHSGMNVISDSGGPISITFATPILSFSGFFTYAEPLVLAAFDASLAQVASVTSTFSSNDALFGDPGSSPNEFLSVSFAGGISSVTIVADSAGSSFVLDDLTYASQVAVPEPRSLSLFLLVIGGSTIYRSFRRRISS